MSAAVIAVTLTAVSGLSGLSIKGVSVGPHTVSTSLGLVTRLASALSHALLPVGPQLEVDVSAFCVNRVRDLLPLLNLVLGVDLRRTTKAASLRSDKCSLSNDKTASWVSVSQAATTYETPAGHSTRSRGQTAHTSLGRRASASAGPSPRGAADPTCRLGGA